MATEQGLRERKKERTRRALIDSAAKLFERKGYEATTIAEIAAAADVSTRTFFSYFPNKEAILFADTRARMELAITQIDGREPGDRPADVLIRVVQHLAIADTPAVDMLRQMAPIRIRLIMTSPAVQGYALRQLLGAQREIAQHLHRAFTDELDELTAGAMVGALVGALIGGVTGRLDESEEAIRMIADRPQELLARLGKAAQVAIGGIATVGAKPREASGQSA